MKKLLTSAGLWFLASLVLAGSYLVLYLQYWDTKHVLLSVSAYSRFVQDLTADVCITEDTVLAAASDRGWRVADNIHAWRAELNNGKLFQESPDDEIERIRIFVRPQMPFAKEPGVVMEFDPRGCLSLRR